MFNPSRLELARRRRGWTKSKLAVAIGVSTKSITNYEAGDKSPSEPTLKRIAEALDFPDSFFAEPEIEVIGEGAASFRSLASMTASQRHQALGAGTLALLVDEWIEQRFTRPVAQVPTVETSDPEQAADLVRAEWGLGQRPVQNMVHLLERHGIRVFSLDEQGREVDAFSFWRDSRPYVLLNTTKSTEHSRFDAAHELGHLVLHRDDERGREAEMQANQFASAFLMPRPSMLAAGLQSATLATLVRRKLEWKVSAVALIYRLRSVGVLTDWQYRTLYIQASKKGYRTTEPNTVQRETSQVLEKVLEHLRNQGVTRREIANGVHLNINDFDRLVFGLVMISQDGGHEGGGRNTSEHPHLRLIGT
ncbi:MAG: ImmA/IrrE family metallo-endopeptidase [Ilumatobacteraceae bacterium]|nr:ImmA/IrrE family metallo-endopeptidase [Ilumatobacteraceae bacterium]